MTPTKQLLATIGLAIISAAVLPLAGAAVELAQPEARLAGIDRFMVFEGSIYLLSGATAGLAIWTLSYQRDGTSWTWKVALTGGLVLLGVPLIIFWIASPSTGVYFVLYALVTVPTMFGAYIVSIVKHTKRGDPTTEQLADVGIR